MSKSLKKPQKTREQHIEDVLVDLEKGLANFQLTVKKKKDKTIKEYVRLYKFTKQEYKKLFQENKLLKKKINTNEKEKIVKKLQKKDNIRYKHRARKKNRRKKMRPKVNQKKLGRTH